MPSGFRRNREVVTTKMVIEDNIKEVREEDMDEEEEEDRWW
jgi:hypothetical protein